MTQPLSDVELKMRTARELPGPGQYGTPLNPGQQSHGNTKFGPAPRRSKSMEPHPVPGPGAYSSTVPDHKDLPRTDTAWKAQEKYYPFMRFCQR